MKKRESGTILIFALIVIAGGAFVMAGLIYVMAARARYTETMVDATKRRIVLENSRMLASQYMLQTALPGTYSGTVSAALVISSGTWGRFSLTSSGPQVPLNSTSFPASVNLFSPGGSGGFTTDIVGTLFDDKMQTYTWLFQARSRSPVLSFDMFTGQKPTISPAASVGVAAGFTVQTGSSGTVALGANAMLWVSGSSFQLTALTYQTPSGTLPSRVVSNYPFLPITSGTTNVTSGYDGQFSVVNPASSGLAYLESALYKAGWPAARTVAGNSDPAPLHVSVFRDTDEATLPNPTVNLAVTPTGTVSGVSSSGTSNTAVTINLSEPGVQRIYILGDATRIVLQGQSAISDATAESLPTLLIVYVESGSSTLSNIDLQGYNNRRVFLAVKKATAGTVTMDTSSGNRQWRLVGTFENTALSLTPDSGSFLQINGGLRSDAAISVAAGATVRVVRETDPDLLEYFADRVGWLEAYMQ